MWGIVGSNKKANGFLMKCEKKCCVLVNYKAQNINEIVKLTMSRVPHRGEWEQESSIYTLTWLNGSEKERALHARAAAVRPARLGVGLGLGLGLVLVLGIGSWWRVSGPIRFFLDQVKLNVLPFNSRKKQHAFYFKQHVVRLNTTRCLSSWW